MTTKLWIKSESEFELVFAYFLKTAVWDLLGQTIGEKFKKDSYIIIPVSRSIVRP